MERLYRSAPEAAQAGPEPHRKRRESRLVDAVGNRGMLRIAQALASGSLKRKCGPACECEECGLQKKAKVGPAGDSHEHEADALADRMVAGNAADAVETADTSLLRKTDGPAGGGESSGLDGLGGGHQLPPGERAFFEGKLGRDLGGVRVHDGGAAAASAQAVGARAFTLGRDIVFGDGEWRPGTDGGRRLLAHELVHWVQQGGRAETAQRTLSVGTDPADPSALPTATAAAQVTPLLNNICSDFTVDATSGVVSANAGTACATGNFGTVASTPGHPVGCCCMCTLARAPDPWKIVVTPTGAPTTDRAARIVRMTPAGTGIGFRHWTAAGTTVDSTPTVSLGHELCGHAALMQIKAHPPLTATDRTFNDVHDPTVRVENAIATEQGIPASDLRGLAASGAHKGESLRVFVADPFDPGSSSTTPVSSAIASAIAFANANPELLIDIVGFHQGPELPSLSLDRANNVATAISAGLTTATATVPPAPGSPAGTAPTSIARVRPATDGGIATPARRVEILMARFQAGLIAPPVAVAGPPVHVGPEFPAVVAAEKAGGPNACHTLLANTAWP